MVNFDKATIYKATGILPFYNRAAKCWCALWLADGHQHRLWIGAAQTTEAIIAEIGKRMELSWINNGGGK